MLTIGLLYLALVSGPAAQKQPLPIPTYGIGEPDKLQTHRSADPNARKYLDDMARCLAGRKRKDAAAALAMPYGSAAQGQAIRGMMLTSDETCWGPSISGISIGFEPQGAAAGMAEYFLANPKALDQARRRDPQAFVWPPQTKMEAFGDCVISQGEAPVRALLDTPVGSDAEQSKAAALAPELGQCISEGQTIAIEPATIRDVLAVELYRRVATPPAAAGTAAAPSRQAQ